MQKIVILTVLFLSMGMNQAMANVADDEEKLDTAIQEFGYVSGAAFQCASSNQARAIEKDVMKSFTGITRLFGSDRAFFYAAAYGVGATETIERSQCPQYIRQFQDAIKKGTFKGQ